MTQTNLVSTDWLVEHINTPDVLPIDGSWYLPTENRDPKAEYLEKHIPNAVFFDIDEICDKSSDLPHMLPSEQEFSSAMSKLGVGNDQTLVIYDGAGLFAAARVWWTFRVMGVERVYILNGGLPKWIADGHPLENGESQHQERNFSARLNHAMVSDSAQILQQLDNKNFQVIDARPEGRFSGKDPEPRPGLKLGHIPGSINIPFPNFINENGCLKNNDELKQVFDNAKVQLNQPITTSCGSGVAASIVSLALSEIGKNDTKIYDGSWSEWGSKDEFPVETGPSVQTKPNL